MPFEIPLRDARTIIAVFENRATSYKNGYPVKEGRQTILFSDASLFDKACKLWEEADHNIESNDNLKRSLMLINLGEEAIVREFWL